MTNIEPNDVLYATIIQRGNTLASLRISGMTSLSDILKYLRRQITGMIGLTTITLRNGSKGWLHKQTVIFAPPT